MQRIRISYTEYEPTYLYAVIVNGIKVATRRTDGPVDIEASLPTFRAFYKTEDVRIIRVY